MSNDNEIRFFQMLKTISDNQNNLSTIINNLVANFTTQLDNFKNQAHDKIDKVNVDVDSIRQEIRQTMDNIMLQNIEREERFRKQNDRIDQLESVFGEISVKICDDKVRENCSEWSSNENAGVIKKYLEKDKSFETTKKTIKESFKKNIIDLITSPSKWPLLIAFFGVCTGFIYGLIKILQDIFKP